MPIKNIEILKPYDIIVSEQNQCIEACTLFLSNNDWTFQGCKTSETDTDKQFFQLPLCNSFAK